MAITERDVVLQGVDESGSPTIDLPITRLGNVEDTAEVKDAPAAGDYIPVMDAADGGQMKKMPAAVFQRALTGTRGQIVGFGADGKPAAQAAPDTGVTSFNGRSGAVKPQSGDYTAAQVGARPGTWMPTAADVGAVPTTRKVNGKALSGDIALTAADVGAATMAQVNSAIKNQEKLSGSGSGDVGELEDLTVRVGRLTNAGAGWNTYKFPEPMEAVPQAVLLQPVDFPGWAEVRDITAEGFLYCLRQPVYTAGQQGSVQTGSFYTATGTSTSAHKTQTLVSGVTLPELPTAENVTTEDAVEVMWMAVEFNGGED